MTLSSAGPPIEGLTFVETLGSGGYADVFRYEQRSPRMSVAVKVLKDGRLSRPELAQFAAEAETMAALADHPNIVQVFATGTLDDGRPYLMMKYYPPPNLAERAARERLAVSAVLRSGIKIASAVETAHRAGILHRDIKPANILVSAYGEPGLTDFGIAGHAADSGEDDDLGVSIAWAAPEVLDGSSNGSVQSDVYSLAATLWHLLAGRAPFVVPSGAGANRPDQLMARTLTLQVPSTGRADVPASLERLLQRAMAKSPGQRFSSSLELARQLQGVEQEQRWPRTELVIEGFGGAQQPAPSGGPIRTGDETRMRAPARPSTPGSTKRKVPSNSKGRDATVLRPARVVPTDQPSPAFTDPVIGSSVVDDEPRTDRAKRGGRSDPTVARAVVVTEQSRNVPGEAQTRGVRRGWAWALAGAAVVAAVVIGVVVSSNGSGSGRTQNTPTHTADLSVDGPPGEPSVTSTYDRSSHELTFSWTYASPMLGDYFVVTELSHGGARHELHIARFPVRTTTPTTTCIQVVAFRAGDTDGSTTSARTCG